MRLRALAVIPCWLVVGCGGTVVETPPNGQGGAGGARHDAGNGGTTRPGCAPIPTAPEYDCQMRLAVAGDCGPWVPDGAIEPNTPGVSYSYPQNCNVRLPRPDAFSGGCGPQQCQCSQFPDQAGAFVPGWVCPL